jgi:hypothetical protein
LCFDEKKRCFDENICVFMSLNVCFDMKTFAFAGFDGKKKWCFTNLHWSIYKIGHQLLGKKKKKKLQR